MKKVKRWLRELFAPEDFNGLDIEMIRSSLNDSSIRSLWFYACLDEIRRMNMEVDKRLLSGTNLQLTDLCARRKAYQDVLEAVLSARRQVVSVPKDVRHNPQVPGINLDRVTE